MLGQGHLHSRPGLVNSISPSPRWILVHFKRSHGQYHGTWLALTRRALNHGVVICRRDFHLGSRSILRVSAPVWSSDLESPIHGHICR